MAKRSKIIAALVLIVAAISLGIAMTTNVSADGESYRSSIDKKALFQGLAKCISDGYMDDVANSGAYTGLESLYKSKSDSLNRPLASWSDRAVKNSKTAYKDMASCKGIITGKNTSGTNAADIKSIFVTMGNQTMATGNVNMGKYLTLKFGYVNQAVGKTECIRYKVPVRYVFDNGARASADRYTDTFCIDYNDKDKKVTNVYWTVDPASVSLQTMNCDWDGGGVGCWYSKWGTVLHERWGWNRITDLKSAIIGLVGYIYRLRKNENAFEIDATKKQFKLKDIGTVSWDGVTIDTFKNNIMNGITNGSNFQERKRERKIGGTYNAAYIAWSNEHSCYGFDTQQAICAYDGNTGITTIRTEVPDTEVVSRATGDEGDGPYSVYTGKDYDQYRAIAQMNDYTGKIDTSDMRSFAIKKTYLTKTEQVLLYMHYLNTNLGADVDCDVPADKQSYYGDPIKWVKDGDTKVSKQCYIKNTSNKDLKAQFNAVGDASRRLGAAAFAGEFAGKIGWDGLVEYFKNLNESLVLDMPSDNGGNEGYNEGTDPRDVISTTEAEADKNCYNSAGSSNWIACPIIDNSSVASEAMQAFITGMLQVNTKLFSNVDGENGTFEAWSAFRNIANIVFIIVFIIVIISQVTGVGIDNYGIKKILPKLVLGALLVNVSYFICQACVDVGNITGGGIKNIFEGIEHSLSNNRSVAFSFAQQKAGAGFIGFNAAAILIGILGAAWYLSGGQILVPILLAAIGVVIGILFLLILLAVRQGLAVALVVLSPLAFVMYMLPNTKSIFSKWTKLFGGVLLAYPLCSLVVYGGQMVSAIILLSAAKAADEGLVVTNFALALTSTILSIAPVFFIPSLIMKSMSGVATVANGLKARATSLGKSAFDRSHTAENMRNVALARKDNLNARSARRALSRYKDDNSLTGRARKRAARNVLLGIDKKNADYYAGEARGMSKDDLVIMGNEAFGADGSFDNEKYDAALAQLFNTGNDEEALKLMSDVSNRAAAANLNGEVLEKIKSTNAQRGGTIGKALSKVQGKAGRAVSLNEAMRDGKMEEAFKGMGDNVIAGMTKDEMSFLSSGSFNLSNLFTNEQLATAAATHTSGKAGDNFNKLLRATGQAASVRDTVSVEQWAKMSEQTLNDLGFTDAQNETFAQSIIDSGDGELMNSVSGGRQRDLINQKNAAKAAAEQLAAQAEEAARNSQAQFQQRMTQAVQNAEHARAQQAQLNYNAQQSQQRFQQRMTQAVNEIKQNMQQPPESFSDGGGI
ncbi:hypothetical protein IKH79_03875 [Candidatus Saccharibacteria bacterium]|nr:hypothetical protein [Candidatus Saccharibacteria bacterium]